LIKADINMTPSETHQALNTAHLVLEEAKQFGVQVEVMVWAVRYMKEDPSLSVEQAIILASNEWIK